MPFVDYIPGGFSIPCPCPCCEQPSDTVERRQLNTAYCDYERNFLTSCEWCYEGAVEMYAEMWAEYYAGCLGWRFP